MSELSTPHPSAGLNNTAVHTSHTHTPHTHRHTAAVAQKLDAIIMCNTGGCLGLFSNLSVIIKLSLNWVKKKKRKMNIVCIVSVMPLWSNTSQAVYVQAKTQASCADCSREVSPSDCRARGICRCCLGLRNDERISPHACATGFCGARSHSLSGKKKKIKCDTAINLCAYFQS